MTDLMIPFGLVLQTEFFQFGITAGDVNCCILFSGGSQSYSMEEFGGKKREEKSVRLQSE